MTAEADRAPDEREAIRLRIEGTWLCREVNEHTCGTGPDGYYGAHEPGCGLIPEVDLSTLPGWSSAADRARAEVQAAVKALADRWLWYARECANAEEPHQPKLLWAVAARKVRAALSDTTALDRMLAEARADERRATLREWVMHPGMSIGSWHPGPAALCDPFCAESLAARCDQIRDRAEGEGA